MSKKLLNEFNYSKNKFLNNLKNVDFVYAVHNNTKKSLLKNSKLLLAYYQNNDLNIKLLPFDVKLTLNYAGLYDFEELQFDSWQKQTQSTHTSKGRCIIKAPRDKSGLTLKYFKDLDNVVFIDGEAVNKKAISFKKSQNNKMDYLKISEHYNGLNLQELKQQKQEIREDATDCLDLIRGLLLEI